MNVLKPHQRGAVITLLENGVSQHEISRKTGIDRKTVRKLALARVAVGGRFKFPHGHRLDGPAGSNSPTLATGSWGAFAACRCRGAGACALGV